jgi:two-component system, NarL family, response regulator NreC
MPLHLFCHSRYSENNFAVKVSQLRKLCNSMNPLRVIIAEDHPAFRHILRLELDCIPEVEIVAEVEDGLELLELLKRVQPDLVIMDISMPNLGGLETARLIKERYCQIKVLFLTMHKNPAYLEQARLIGTAGYLLKEEVDQELLPAINMIKRGGCYISGALVQ